MVVVIEINQYLKTSQTFKHSNPLKSSPGSHSQSVSNSVGITSSCSFLAFPLLLKPHVITFTLPLLPGISNL